MSAVWTAESHRHITAACRCSWDWPGPESPWVLMRAHPGCPVHSGAPKGTAAELAARRRFWEMRAAGAQERRDAAEKVLEEARRELAALGAVVAG